MNRRTTLPKKLKLKKKKKNQTEILELKNSVNEMKTAIENITAKQRKEKVEKVTWR